MMSKRPSRIAFLPHAVVFAICGGAVIFATGWPKWIGWTLGGSVYTLLIFGCDKWRARKNKGRIAELTLLTLTALGGSPGALLAMPLFRHKTRKTSFRIAFWACAIISAGVIYVIWRWVG
jgi:uncharacterized membrane protein YsdA (DUF1294 family)